MDIEIRKVARLSSAHMMPADMLALRSLVTEFPETLTNTDTGVIITVDSKERIDELTVICQRASEDGTELLLSDMITSTLQRIFDETDGLAAIDFSCDGYQVSDLPVTEWA